MAHDHHKKQMLTTYGTPAVSLVNPLELSTLIRKKDAVVEAGSVHIERAELGYDNATRLDMGTWLPFCSKVYNISADVNDYILIPVVTIMSDLPNRNGVGFPLAELIMWNAEHGQQAYKTFKGKPVYVEHNNNNYLDARGVIVDVMLRRMDGFAGGKIWKVIELLAIDRTKDPVIAKGLLSREMNSFSMGAWVTHYQCSYCNADMGKCGHLNARNRMDFYEHEGHLVFRHACGIIGFETSVVADPAYRSAISDKLMTFT